MKWIYSLKFGLLFKEIQLNYVFYILAAKALKSGAEQDLLSN